MNIKIKVKDLIKYLEKKPQNNYIYLPNWEYAKYDYLYKQDLYTWKIRAKDKVPKFKNDT